MSITIHLTKSSCGSNLRGKVETSVFRGFDTERMELIDIFLLVTLYCLSLPGGVLMVRRSHHPGLSAPVWRDRGHKDLTKETQVSASFGGGKHNCRSSFHLVVGALIYPVASSTEVRSLRTSFVEADPDWEPQNPMRDVFVYGPGMTSPRLHLFFCLCKFDVR